MSTRSTLLAVGLFITGIAGQAQATSFYFSGAPISGEAGTEYPTLAPEGSASFDVSGDILTLTIVYDGVRDLSTGDLVTVPSLNLALSGATFSIDSSWTGSLDPLSVMVGGVDGNADDLDKWRMLVAAEGGPDVEEDFSGQVVFSEDAVGGTLYAVAAAGSVFGDGEFTKEVFDPTKTLTTPVPGGGDFLLVPELFDPTLGGFKKQGPVGTNTIEYKWTIGGDGLTAYDFWSFTPIFGSEGQPAIPEPTSAVLFLVGALVVGRTMRRRPPTEA